MRKILGLVGATLLMAGPAVAADLAVKAPPALMPAFSWTGCYIGGDVGGAWDRQDVSVTSVNVGQAPVGNTLNGSSIIGGVYAGCNWQFAPQWVLGAEGDFSWTKLDDSATAPNFSSGGTLLRGGVAWSRNLDRLASARGRLGFAVMPNMLVFATGGIAWEHSDYAALDAFDNGVVVGCPNCLAVAFSNTHDGWVAGGGIDWAPWNNNWIFRLEYLHYQFPGVSASAAFNARQSATFNWGDLSVDSIRAGVAFKF